MVLLEEILINSLPDLGDGQWSQILPVVKSKKGSVERDILDRYSRAAIKHPITNKGREEAGKFKKNLSENELRVISFVCENMCDVYTKYMSENLPLYEQDLDFTKITVELERYGKRIS
jgi:hypothetical protein